MANRYNTNTIYFAWEEGTPFFKIGTAKDPQQRLTSLYKNHGYNQFSIICTGYHHDWEFVQQLEEQILGFYNFRRKDVRYQTTTEEYKKLDGSVGIIKRRNSLINMKFFIFIYF